MKFFKGMFGGRRPMQGSESDDRMVVERPSDPMADGSHDPKALEQFLAENKKRMAEAEANAPAAPQGPPLSGAEERERPVGAQYTDGWLEGAAEVRAEKQQAADAAFAQLEGQKRSQVGGSAPGQKDNIPGIAASRAKEASERRAAARTSTPSTGRSL